MESEKLSLTKGNRLIKKRFALLMKGHKDFLEDAAYRKTKDRFYGAIVHLPKNIQLN